MTASLTHGNSDNVVNTVTITNGNFDDATITTQLGQMLASVNLTLDNAELPNLELLAAEIQNGKMELALSVNPADSSVTLAITSVVYDKVTFSTENFKMPELPAHTSAGWGLQQRR